MEENKEKRVLKVELDDDVKKVSITGLGDDDKVVMMQELSEEDLDEATGGMGVPTPHCFYNKRYDSDGNICKMHGAGSTY